MSLSKYTNHKYSQSQQPQVHQPNRGQMLQRVSLTRVLNLIFIKTSTDSHPKIYLLTAVNSPRYLSFHIAKDTTEVKLSGGVDTAKSN